MAMAAVLAVAAAAVVNYEPAASPSSLSAEGDAWTANLQWLDTTLQGTASAKDNMWLDMQGYGEQPVLLRLLSEDGAKDLSENVDGVLGILDARNESFISSISGKRAAVNYHALFLGIDTVPGQLQVHGYDHGTFERPQFFKIPEKCMLQNNPCYGSLRPSKIRFEVEGGTTTLMQKNSPLVYLELDSASPSIELPEKMHEQVTNMGKDSGAVLHFHFGTRRLSVPIWQLQQDLAHTVVPTNRKHKDALIIVLGAPIFRLFNVVFETDFLGALIRIGFATTRKTVAATEEFIVAQVSFTDDQATVYPTVPMGIGGAWGPVQLEFHMITDTRSSGVIIRSGKHTGPVSFRPHVGSFIGAVGVLLCICPILICFVLRDAKARHNTSKSPKPAAKWETSEAEEEMDELTVRTHRQSVREDSFQDLRRSPTPL